MAFNREIWLKWSLRKPCPSCDIGTLNIPTENSFIKTETSYSRDRNSYGTSYYSDYVFSLHLKCDNCKERVVVCGSLSEDHFAPGPHSFRPEKSFTPVCFYPAPKIISVPESCPSDVTKTLSQSYGLFWIDIGACANKIRIAVEVLLNELKVPKGQSLHKRLLKLQRENSEIANLLISIKWIGNGGSHYEGVTKNEVLDAYEILEYTLGKIYNDHEQKILKLSKDINLKNDRSYTK